MIFVAMLEDLARMHVDVRIALRSVGLGDGH